MHCISRAERNRRKGPRSDDLMTILSAFGSVHFNRDHSQPPNIDIGCRSVWTLNAWLSHEGYLFGPFVGGRGRLGMGLWEVRIVMIDHSIV